MKRGERFQNMMETRTRWILIITVIILVILVGFFLELYYISGGVLSGRPTIDLGGGGSGSTPGGGTPEEATATTYPGGGSEPYCGDYHIDSDIGEECDLGGNPSPNGTCTDSCTWTFCGDSMIQQPNGKDTVNGSHANAFNEQCDDGNSNVNDACVIDVNNNYLCQNAFCGDGYQWINNCGGNPLLGISSRCESCDDGNDNDFDFCFNNCTINPNPRTSFCGDGVVQQPNFDGFNEQCDDGNNINNDACSNECTLNPGLDENAICGDGVVQAPNDAGFNEQCDDGNLVGGDGCTNCRVDSNPDTDSSSGGRSGSGSSSSGSNNNPDSNTDRGTNYVIDNNNNFGEGRFAQIIVSLNDKMEFTIDKISYTLRIFAVTDEAISIEITTPRGTSFVVAPNKEISLIDVEDNQLAIKVEDITEDLYAYITLASLGKTEDIQEAVQEQPIENIFEETISQESNSVPALKVLSTEDKQRIRTVLLVITGVLVLVFLVKLIRVSRNRRFNSKKRR